MAGNPFTSAQAPAYNLIAPDIGAQQAQLSRQQQLADYLRAQAMQQDQGTQVINGWAVKKSPMEGISKVAQALMGRYAQSKVDEKQLNLAKAMQDRTAGMFGMGGGADGGAMSPAGAPAIAPAMPVDPRPNPIDPMQMTEGAMAGPSAQPQPAPMQAPPQQAPQPQTQQRNLTLSGMSPQEAFRAYAMDPSGYMSSYLKQFDSTDLMKNDRYLGIDPNQTKATELAKRLKEGTITALPGQTNYLPNGQTIVAPNFETGIAGGFDAQGNPIAREVQGSTQIAADRAGQVAEATARANAGQKMVTVNIGGRPVMMTEAQAVQMSGGGAPQGGGTQFANPNPGGMSLDFQGGPQAAFDKISQIKDPALRAQAMEALKQMPNSAPGASPVGGVGISGSTPAEDAQRMADVKLRTEPQLTQKTQEYKDMAEYGKTLDGHVSESQALLQRVKESRDALTQFKAGGGAENRAKLASTAQAFGMPDALVNKIAGGDLAAAQVFQKFAAQEALGTMQQALASDSGKGSQGNRISMELFIKNNPNITTDPNAIEKVFNFITTQAEQTRAQQEAYHQWKNDPTKDPSAFPGFWAGESIKRGYVTPVQSTGNALGTTASVSNAADYEKLPSGAMYRAPDGHVRRKP